VSCAVYRGLNEGLTSVFREEDVLERDRVPAIPFFRQFRGILNKFRYFAPDPPRLTPVMSQFATNDHSRAWLVLTIRVTGPLRVLFVLLAS
jgi:hypothetical protein